MRSAARRCLVVLLILIGYISCAHAQAAREPLTDGELMALVAGNALSENIVHAIESRGLAFRPGEQYRSLITTAGGGAPILAALKNAKIGDHADSGEPGKFLQHLAAAGKLI